MHTQILVAAEPSPDPQALFSLLANALARALAASPRQSVYASMGNQR